MAIFKNSENTKILVSNSHLVKAGKLNQVSKKVNIEAATRNLTLISNKKVLMHGNK